jgi:hypothetical protein
VVLVPLSAEKPEALIVEQHEVAINAIPVRIELP